MPPVFLAGNRVVLRPLGAEHVTDAYLTWLNDREAMQYLESRYFPHTRESVLEFVKTVSSSRSEIFLAICDRQTGEHVGNIKLGPIDWIHRRADIGILIGSSSARGKGFGSEAIDLLAGYAFEGLNLGKVTAGCYRENVASQKAFEKAGFKVEGELKAHYFSKGRYTDGLLMARLREGRV